MELSNLEELLKLATKYGVVRLWTSEVEIELGNKLVEEPAVSTLSPNQITPDKVEISDEDLLYWSVNGQVPSFEEKKAS